MVARVWVNHCPLHIDKAYDYAVLPALAGLLQIGMRVIVPFGKGNKKQEAMVTELAGEGAEIEGSVLKPVLALLDKEPAVNAEMLALTRFIKERCFCAYYDALRLMLPPRSTARFHSYVSLNPHLTITEMEEICRTQKQKDILFYIWENDKRVAQSELEEKFPKSGAALRALIGQKMLIRESDYILPMKESCEKRFEPALPAEEAQKVLSGLRKDSAGRYRKVLELLQKEYSVEEKKLCSITGLSPLVLKTMEKKGLIQKVMVPAPQAPSSLPSLYAPPPAGGEEPLSAEQEKVFLGLKEELLKNKAGCALLKGVTGSGKTHVYLKLIEEATAQNKRAIVLVPEIALTPQMVGRFTARFGEQVGVLHSAMTIRERTDMWGRIRRGEISLLIGTRMAIFAPMENIGVIIMDEEQEGSYKSENTPHYHARELAKFRCVAHGALLLLASATPSLESYYNAQIGKYSYYELKERYNQSSLPAVTIVDMGKEMREGNDSLFSREMRSLLAECFEAGRQAVLLLNRRGYSSFAACRECGYIPKCPNCSLSLTFHTQSDSFLCHYCGHTMSSLATCPACGSSYLKYVGFGTQRVEAELKELFPALRIMRLDADSTKEKNAHFHILQEFGEKRADLLLGTQMVAKGLDFPNVTFVGVLSADASLYLDDYRSAENTFSMLTQVVGRSGRGGEPGKALIQTLSPGHGAIQFAAKQDYEGFYQGEIAMREQMGYPPFYDLCLLTLSGLFESQVKEAAGQIAKILRSSFEKHKSYIRATLLGPAPAPIVKLNNRYRYRVIIKCKNDKNFRLLLGRFISHFTSLKGNKNYILTADFNPYNML